MRWTVMHSSSLRETPGLHLDRITTGYADSLSHFLQTNIEKVHKFGNGFFYTAFMAHTTVRRCIGWVADIVLKCWENGEFGAWEVGNNISEHSGLKQAMPNSLCLGSEPLVEFVTKCWPHWTITIVAALEAETGGGELEQGIKMARFIGV
jgi:hypothetical protein